MRTKSCRHTQVTPDGNYCQQSSTVRDNVSWENTIMLVMLTLIMLCVVIGVQVSGIWNCC